MVDYKRMNQKTTAVCAAISSQHGVLLWQDYGKSVNIEKFIDFLQRLSAKMKHQMFYLYFDNLAVHHSKVVRAEMQRLKITPIFSPAYCP